MNRRSILQAGIASTLAALRGAAQGKRDNRIVQENSKPGTPEWQLQYTRFDNPISLAAYPLNRRIRSSAIEGYCSRTSVLPGQTIDFMIGMSPAGKFHMDVYRMGYYGGTGGRHMLRLGPFNAEPRPIPMMKMERLRECAWPKSASLTIPTDWPSGVYLGKLTRDEPFGAQSYVVFVVKEHRRCDLLFQVADLTWQAYNKWPGNNSLYDDGTPEVWYTGPNVRVSFDRPYGKYCQVIDAPLSSGSGSFLLWEHPLAFWLEQHGYDVTYCSNLDLHLDPGILKTAKVLLSVGHDEYWSRKMFEEALKARDEGLSIAFLSGNAVDGEIVFYESSVTGAPCRAFARRQKFEDEETLMGSSSYGSGYGDWIVTKPDHWIYEGTNLKAGDRIRGVIGWEYHGKPLARIAGLEVVASAPLFPTASSTGPPREHAAVVYPCPKGNWVFNAGTIWWSEHLSFPPGHIPARTSAGGFGVNPLIQRITTNVLSRMSKDSPRRW
ncbi:MAG: N,N-dimethylformamidase beta subunit family domain-containing protein [Acidobacteriota bacterium]